MKVKQLLFVLFNIEEVRICKDDDSIDWSGYAFNIPYQYYNYNIDKVCSFPCYDSCSCSYIFIK